MDDEAAVLPRDRAVRATVEHHPHAIEGEVCKQHNGFGSAWTRKNGSGLELARRRA